MSSPDPLSLERQVCFALTVASRSVVAAYKPVLDPMGITHPQYLVMLALWAEEPLTVTELAARLHQDAPTLSPLLKRLETRGLVKRMRSTADERRLEISLTDEGDALKSQAAEVPFVMAKRLGMEPARLVQLHEAMIELIEASQRSLELKA
ncbi:MarR family winged helix-turn-helix transcriptional regulator [Agrococcus casei]|uniref:MarR family winged helix-turn-helix transcriptional regulator n=1 Tax=Agrococcus casei TaxID=343512 RepID=UPI003F91CEF6